MECRQTIFRGGGMQADNIQRWWNAGRQYSGAVERCSTVLDGTLITACSEDPQQNIV